MRLWIVAVVEVASLYFALETRSTCPVFCVSNTLKRLSITISALHLENNNVAPGGRGNNNVLSTFYVHLGQSCATSAFGWFLLISPSRQSTLVVHFFPQLLWKKLRNKLIQLNLVDLVLGEVDLEGVPQRHHLQLCELVLLSKKNNWIFLFQIFVHLLIYGFFLFLLLLFLFLLLILVLFRLVKSNRRNEVPAKFL